MPNDETVDTRRFELDRTTRLGYKPSLDGIRALAVLPVMVGHAVSTLAPGGYTGVRLFFVLSGFLITTLLLEEFADKGSIRLGAFYARRALRLLPALFLLLASYLSIITVINGFDAVRQLAGNVVAIVFYVANWRFVARGHGGDLGHLWSLSVEEQFYLLWPLGLFLMLRFLRMRTMLITIASVAAGSWVVSELLALSAGGKGAIANVDSVQSVAQRHASYGTDAVAYALLAGCLVALLRSSGRLRRDARYGRWLERAGLVGVAMYACQIMFSPSARLREIDLLVLTIAFLAIILCAVDAPDSLLSRALRLAPLRAIGRVSYGLYLWHFVILALLRHHQPHMSVPERTFVAAVLTTAAVVFSYKIVEQPFLRLKRRFVADPLAAGHPE